MVWEALKIQVQPLCYIQQGTRRALLKWRWIEVTMTRTSTIAHFVGASLRLFSLFLLRIYMHVHSYNLDIGI